MFATTIAAGDPRSRELLDGELSEVEVGVGPFKDGAGNRPIQALPQIQSYKPGISPQASYY
jgi:hypothetical protein